MGGLWIADFLYIFNQRDTMMEYISWQAWVCVPSYSCYIENPEREVRVPHHFHRLSCCRIILGRSNQSTSRLHKNLLQQARIGIWWARKSNSCWWFLGRSISAVLESFVLDYCLDPNPSLGREFFSSHLLQPKAIWQSGKVGFARLSMVLAETYGATGLIVGCLSRVAPPLQMLGVLHLYSTHRVQ